MSTTLPENASWLVNAGLDDMQRRLASMTGTPQDLADLRAAIIHEKAQPTPRVSRLKPMEAKLRKFSDAITTASEKILLTKNGAPTPTTPDPLAAAAAAILRLETERLELDRRHQLNLMPILLKQGLHCLKAHVAFCINAGKGGRPKKPSTVDGILSQGFEGWLKTTAPTIPKASAYRYMQALRGLGLDETATEAQVEAAVAARIAAFEKLSLKALCDAAAPGQKPEPEIKSLEQGEFDFLRQSLSHFREESEHLCRLKPQLDQYPDFKRAATARIYSMLYELTGTHWQPSDEPDELATINPDTIEL